VHDEAPAEATVPPRHGVFVLEPSQLNPAGHGEQASRVFPSVAPPVVNEPAGQVAQLVAPAVVEYFLSLPHDEHDPCPAAAKEPAAHLVWPLFPLHA